MSTNREEIRKQNRMLADLRKQYGEHVKQAQALLKEQQTARKTLRRAMQAGPKSVPQLAEVSEMPAHEVLWHIAAMKKYGLVVEDSLDEDYEYYLYSLAEEVNL